MGFVLHSFSQKTLDENVHVNAFSKLKHVGITFGSIFQCFAQIPSYLFCSFPPLLAFWFWLIFFDVIFMQVFWIAHKLLDALSNFSPHFLWRDRLHSHNIYLPMAYLLSWAFVAPFNTTTFLSIFAHFYWRWQALVVVICSFSNPFEIIRGVPSIECDDLCF